MTKKTLKLPLVLALTLALLAVLGMAVPFAFAGDDAAQTMEKTTPDQQQDMQAMHEQMMQRHQQMLDEMKQGQAKLDSLVEQMKSAKGDAKDDAIVAVLEELVAQHQKAMSQRIEMMEGMGGMAGHGMAGHGMKGHGGHGMSHGGHGGHGGKAMMKGECPHCDGSCQGKAQCADCPMKGQGMKCDDCPMKDGMKGDCPMHEKGKDCPMHKEMKKDMAKEGDGTSSDGR